MRRLQIHVFLFSIIILLAFSPTFAQNQLTQIIFSGQGTQNANLDSLQKNFLDQVGQIAEYEGGFDALHIFLKSKIKYNKGDIKTGSRFFLFIQFTITHDRKVYAKALNALDQKMAKSAVKAMESTAKKWKPATKNNQPVDWECTMSVLIDS